MNSPQTHPLIQCNYYIKPDKIFIKKEYYKESSGFSSAFIANQVNLLDNKTKGLVSDKSASRIKSAVNWLVASTVSKRVTNPHTKQRFSFKVNLLTLTLAQEQGDYSDKELKSKFLQPMLKRLKRKCDLKNYIWKAEAQANGNIHFHIVSDKFIDYLDLQNMWNDILYKNGQLVKFFEKFGHYNPHSTEVKSVKGVKNLASYLVKYLTKKEKSKRLIGGRLWGCNYGLSQANKCSLSVYPSEVQSVLKDVNFSKLEHKVLESEPDQFGNTIKYGDLYFIKQKDWGVNIMGRLNEVYQNHIKQIREQNTKFFRKKREQLKHAILEKKESIQKAMELNKKINPNPFFENECPPVVIKTVYFHKQLKLNLC